MVESGARSLAERKAEIDWVRRWESCGVVQIASQRRVVNLRCAVQSSANNLLARSSGF